MMADKYNVLILGASYGSLLATKLLMGGHKATMVCRTATAALFNEQGSLVRMPIRGREGLVEIRSSDLPGELRAATPDEIDVSQYDMAVLAMSEPQYGAPGVRELLGRIMAAKLPSMSIMNMPPPPYMKRIAGLDVSKLSHCYLDADLWEGFDPAMMTLASPDPQAFRPPEEAANVLQVTLPTNFKVARFESEAHTAMLRRIEADIEAARFEVDGEALEIPVKLRVYDSIFVPLAKWAMLLTGNYRCVQPNAPRAIKEAVHSDIAASEDVYNWVCDLCVRMGADPADMVPFEKYAKAATGLAKPSSAARALFGGAVSIERVDALVQGVARSKGLSHPSVDETVRLVDARLAMNAEAAKHAAE